MHTYFNIKGKSDNSNPIDITPKIVVVKGIRLCFNECFKRILHNSYIGNHNNNPYPLLNLQITLIKQYAKTVGVIRCILI